MEQDGVQRTGAKGEPEGIAQDEADTNRMRGRRDPVQGQDRTARPQGHLGGHGALARAHLEHPPARGQPSLAIQSEPEGPRAFELKGGRGWQCAHGHSIPVV